MCFSCSECSFFFLLLLHSHHKHVLLHLFCRLHFSSRSKESPDGMISFSLQYLLVMIASANNICISMAENEKKMNWVADLVGKY